MCFNIQKSLIQWQVLVAVPDSTLNLRLTIVLLTVKYTAWIAEKAVRAVF